MRWGIRAVVAESFAEIFYGNCLALGIPCLIANQTTALQLQEEANQNPKPFFNLDIKTATVSAAGKSWNLELAGGSQQMLLSGRWDGTAQLIANNEALNKTATGLPYLNNFQ
jgi:3-isopropylmalate/(R)-2-methylmalate dehydratase small subunit